jgi:hypothetical protein
MKLNVRIAMGILGLVLAGGAALRMTVKAQTDGGPLAFTITAKQAPLTNINWLGPFALTKNDTVLFNYWNGGSAPVAISWQLSNAETGEAVCGDLSQITVIGAGKGTSWPYSQTIDANGVETRHCGGKDVVSDEIYFDAFGRHSLVAWIIMRHADARAHKLAVDLPSIELYNSMLMPPPADFDPPAPIRSMTFGRTFAVIYANPTAPTDLALQQLAAGR